MEQRAGDGNAMSVLVTTLDAAHRPPKAETAILTGAAGPVLAGTRAPSRSIAEGTFTSVLDTRARIFLALCSAGWLGCFVMFWVWWLDSSHLVTWAGMLINGAVLFYLSYNPAYFILLVNRLRGVSTEFALPTVRVGFVVTKAPSEPWPMARTTLLAMLSQRFDAPFDVWLCDEDPSEEVLTWCHGRGVRVSTRHGQPDYHRARWPGRTKCKEGNLAFFYDRVGYRDYDVVAQLDCDHVPAADYLTEMVRPFADPAIGYVAAPSICDANANQSWSARGRLYREAPFHGPLQLGHHDGLAPVCIGSHYAVRTKALREIGGIGPELAEDFSTTFLLTSAGWQGAFAHRAEAHGEGPRTFSAMLTQEFQWSRSLFTVVLELLPGHLRRLPWRLRARYLMALSYYPLIAVTTAAGLALPPIAAVTGLSWVNVGYFEFLARWFSVSVWVILMTVFLRAKGLLRPTNAPILSWEAWLFILARWPYIAWGVIAAAALKLRPRAYTFKVTPKTSHGLERLQVALVMPYVTITAALAIAALVGELTHPRFSGYVALSILGSATYCVVTFVICLLHAREATRSGEVSFLKAVRTTVAGPLVAGLVAAIPLVVAMTFAVEKVSEM